jgi:hypothetical protein
MLSRRLLIFAALVFAGATAVAAAQNVAASTGKGTVVRGKHMKMLVVTESSASRTAPNLNDAGLVTIFSNLAEKYPKGLYWCCSSVGVFGPGSGNGQQWMAAAFTPAADHSVTKIEVAVGWAQQGTNGVVVSLSRDNKGIPGKALKRWNVSNLPRSGDCCTLVVRSDSSGIPVAAGKQYWIVLTTNNNEKDTMDGWNVVDSDQVDSATVATFPGNKNQWEVFQNTPGLGFAVKGSN